MVIGIAVTGIIVVTTVNIVFLFAIILIVSAVIIIRSLASLASSDPTAIFPLLSYPVSMQKLGLSKDCTPMHNMLL
ncbi:hypothetical protein P7K49_038308 [Saguinus oedipus]|uniref:Uncharacterized protein n=1 Tax=Saguinus oedipus TaxID=9490 RepID=A0ABQ9TEA8_SAGOE|nr:hypothetical protein P7K49_038308 [Saguinus oedipus]